MQIKFSVILFFVVIHLFSLPSVNAQDIHKINPASDSTAPDITIVYDIAVKSNNERPGIGETYNGGIKTLFISSNRSRVRLVTLMRIQSIFFSTAEKGGTDITLVKEFGKKKYKINMSPEDWEAYNSKYDSSSCQLMNDSLQVLDYLCRKAVVTLQDGRQISVFYTDKIMPRSSFAEPAFKCVPGMVLQYQYISSKGNISVTASVITHKKIDAGIFKIPVKDFMVKKYCRNCQPKASTRSGDTSDIN